MYGQRPADPCQAFIDRGLGVRRRGCGKIAEPRSPVTITPAHDRYPPAWRPTSATRLWLTRSAPGRRSVTSAAVIGRCTVGVVTVARHADPRPAPRASRVERERVTIALFGGRPLDRVRTWRLPREVEGTVRRPGRVPGCLRAPLPKRDEHLTESKGLNGFRQTRIDAYHQTLTILKFRKDAETHARGSSECPRHGHHGRECGCGAGQYQ